MKFKTLDGKVFDNYKQAKEYENNLMSITKFELIREDNMVSLYLIGTGDIKNKDEIVQFASEYLGGKSKMLFNSDGSLVIRPAKCSIKEVETKMTWDKLLKEPLVPFNSQSGMYSWRMDSIAGTLDYRAFLRRLVVFTDKSSLKKWESEAQK